MNAHQKNAAEALAIVLDMAADKEGFPFAPGAAQRIAHRVFTDSAPILLDAIAESAKGRVS